MRTDPGLPLETVITIIRRNLVPHYTPYPFRRNSPESYLDMLCSIVATYLYRKKIEELKKKDVDFSTFLYVPEIDPIMGTQRHDRSDHNHLFRRVAKSVREGKDHLLDPKSGLTHAALIGKWKQSLVDAERLLSYHVVESIKASWASKRSEAR